MNLTPAQSQIAKDTHRFRVVNAGRRFGKSTLISWEMFGMAVSNDNARIPYYAPTRDDARDIMWGMLKKVCEPLIVDVNEGRLEITIKNKFGGTSQILLYGWEAVQERGKGVGVKNNHIFLDEVSKYKNFWQGWQEILRPTLTDLQGGATFISTPNGFNHFYDLYNMEVKDSDYKSFHFTSYDNQHLPVEEIEKARKELPEDRFAQEYLADFRKKEGLVYKEFKRDKHLFDDTTDRGTTVLTLQGIDWGYRHNAVVLDIEKTANGHYWVVDEWSESGKTDEETINYAGAKKANKVYADPESPQAIDKAKKEGLNICDVVKGKNSINSGIDTVQEMFKQGTLHIHRKCVKLIASLEIYSYEEKSDRTSEEGKDECDALRYPLMMEDKNIYEEDDTDFDLYGSMRFT